MKIFLEHFSVRLPKERVRRQYGDRCGRSRSPSRSDGGDPAASSYGEREATQGKPLKKCSRGFEGFHASNTALLKTACTSSRLSSASISFRFFRHRRRRIRLHSAV